MEPKTDLLAGTDYHLSSDRSDLGLVKSHPSLLRTIIEEGGVPHRVDSDAEMSDFLDLILERAISDYKVGPAHSTLPVSPTLKWRYSSAYQKAVRRNDPSIETVAAALNACDPAYIWRRAPTIALEDVSLGDPWVVALVIHGCRFAKTRTRYGPDRLAAFLGQLMGQAVKDRLSCDAFCLPCYHPGLAHVRREVGRMAADEQAQLYRSDDTPFPWRVCAGMALAGPRYGDGLFGGHAGSPDQLSEVVQDLAPFPIQWISRQYARKARDGMFVTLPIVWRKMRSEVEVEVVHGQLPVRHLINGVLSATFDGHTLEGRKAISRFGSACGAVAELLADVPKKQEVLKLAVFTMDSTLLDKRLLSPWSEALYRRNLEGEVLAAGLPLSQFDALTELLVEERDMLNSFRSIAAI